MKKERHAKGNICPLCKHQGVYLFSQKDRRIDASEIFPVFHCTVCNVDFIKAPKHISTYYKKSYYGDTVNTKDWFFRFKQNLIILYYKDKKSIKKWILSYLIRFISSLPSKKGRIMDIGCGTGDILVILKKAGFDVYGIDINRHAVTIARKHGLPHIRCGTEALLFSYPNNYFHFIRASHVLEHMKNPKKFLEYSFKKLKPRGTLLIQTPNIGSTGILFGKYAVYYYDIPRHLVLFSHEGLKTILHNIGFHTVTITYTKLFSGTLSGILIFLEDRLHWIDNKKFTALSANYFLHALFLPIDMLLGFTGKGQIMSVRALK